MTQSILAGFMIGIGNIALMTSGNQFVGALLFSVALMTVIYFELPLYTGRIGTVIQDRSYLSCLLALVFNTVGAVLAVWMFKVMSPENAMLIKNVAHTKYSKGLLALFIAGIFCNVLIHIAVSTKHSIMVILCVMAFIVCGFEHSIADVPYMLLDFSYANLLGWVMVLAGNTVGGIATQFLLSFMENRDSGGSEEEHSEDELGEPDIQEPEPDIQTSEPTINGFPMSEMFTANTASNVIDGEFTQVKEGEE